MKCPAGLEDLVIVYPPVKSDGGNTSGTSGNSPSSEIWERKDGNQSPDSQNSVPHPEPETPNTSKNLAKESDESMMTDT